MQTDNLNWPKAFEESNKKTELKQNWTDQTERTNRISKLLKNKFQTDTPDRTAQLNGIPNRFPADQKA